MERTDTMIVAREGWPYLAGSLGVFVLAVMADWDLIQFLAFFAAVLVAYVYRNPERIVPHFQENSIVSVADGRVTAIETVDSCPLIECPCYRVDIVSSTLNTSLLRAPFTGRLDSIELRRGSRLAALSSLAESLNERAIIGFTSPQGQQCAVEHLLDKSIEGIAIHPRAETQLPQGGRYGLMVKGLHSLYLPSESRVALHIGDEVRAGETLVGYFS